MLLVAAQTVGVHVGERDHAGTVSCDSCSGHPALLRPRPAITAATAFPSREGAPQYLNRAFSAPRICTVDAGYLARLVRLPACEMRRAPTCNGRSVLARVGGEVAAAAESRGPSAPE